ITSAPPASSPVIDNAMASSLKSLPSSSPSASAERNASTHASQRRPSYAARPRSRSSPLTHGKVRRTAAGVTVGRDEVSEPPGELGDDAPAEHVRHLEHVVLGVAVDPDGA